MIEPRLREQLSRYEAALPNFDEDEHNRKAIEEDIRLTREALASLAPTARATSSHTSQRGLRPARRRSSVNNPIADERAPEDTLTLFTSRGASLVSDFPTRDFR
jgi:hypothetical protein